MYAEDKYLVDEYNKALAELWYLPYFSDGWK